MNIFFSQTQFIFSLNFIIEFEDEVFMSSLYFSTLKASRWASNGGHEAAKSNSSSSRQLLYRTVDQYRFFHSKFIFSRAFQLIHLIQDLKKATTRPECEACLEKAGLTMARSFNLKTKRAGIWYYKEARLALHRRMSTWGCHVILDWGPIINRFNTGSHSL